MRIEYHPAVAEDVAEALERYESASQSLGDEFKLEVRRVVGLAAACPRRFHLIKPGLHRANLKRFPYHVIYREMEHGIRVTLVRHHRRDPNFGMERR